MNKSVVWGVLLILFLIIGGTLISDNNTPSASPNSEDMIKIGVIAPLTGWGAYWGEGFIKGLELATEEIKSKGGKIEAIIEDGATDAAKSASAAQKLINVDKINALLVEFTGPSSSVSPIAAQNKIPMIYDSLVKKFVDDNPYAFKFYFDIRKQCEIATNYLVKQGHKNIGGILLNLDFAPECQSAMEEVATKTGVNVKTYKFNIDTTDLKTSISKMKSDGVDAIVPVFYEDHAISFFKQRSDLGFRVPVFMGIGIPDGLTEKVRVSVPTDSLEGVIAYDQPIADEFLKRLREKYPNITEKDHTSAAYGYDELMYLWNGLSACPLGEPECVVQKIKDDKHVGAVQSPGFGPDRIFDITPTYYQFTNGKLIEFALD